MPAYYDIFVAKQLQFAEYQQLISKGYLKVRVGLSLEHVKQFTSTYKVGDAFVFVSPDKRDLPTRISSIDVGESYNSNYKVFIGFTLE
jgi:hypothetical protein